jgi:hypothetical protein
MGCVYRTGTHDRPSPVPSIASLAIAKKVLNFIFWERWKLGAKSFVQLLEIRSGQRSIGTLH